jgi:hypothetical protein
MCQGRAVLPVDTIGSGRACLSETVVDVTRRSSTSSTHRTIVSMPSIEVPGRKGEYNVVASKMKPLDEERRGL